MTDDEEDAPIVGYVVTRSRQNEIDAVPVRETAGGTIVGDDDGPTARVPSSGEVVAAFGTYHSEADE